MTSLGRRLSTGRIGLVPRASTLFNTNSSSFFANSKPKPNQLRTHARMVYTLICHAEVKPGCEQKMADKLREAAAIYKKDRETIDWLVHQDEKEPTKFAIVERFEHESSQKYHLENPYWATFNPAVEPWLAKPIQILRFNEL